MKGELKFPKGLYGVTPDWDDVDQLEQAVRQAIAGGLRSLQLRHKTASPDLRRRLALRLLPLCRDAGVPLIINDDWRLAADIGADGVHLGQHDEDPADVRTQLGADMLIGVSCYANLARAQALLPIDPTYIAFGAMFSSSTKPLAPPAPLSVLDEGKELLDRSGKPHIGIVAIGGITVDNARQLILAGANALAVVGGLFHVADITDTARRFAELFNELS